ncbi:hypothetical protein HC766_01585, partial [Candidatus Gracilibacteria bacterium]|nr:hypothetical protein [Candidatus Gracilibacteria bacterium]
EFFTFFKKNILDAQYSKNVTILDSCLVINDKWDIEKTQNDLKPYSDNVLQKLAELEKTEIDIMGKNYRDGVFLGVR